MAKRKDDETVDPRAPVESEWGGLTKWDCPFCPRDSFDREDVVAHIAHAHPEPGLSVPEALAAARSPQTSSAPVVEPSDAPPGQPATDTPDESPGKDG
jgi:hypothetical protein